MARGDKQIPAFVLKGGSFECKFSCCRFADSKVLPSLNSLKRNDNLLWEDSGVHSHLGKSLVLWSYHSKQKETQARRAEFNCFQSLLLLNELRSWIWNVLASSFSGLNLQLTGLYVCFAFSRSLCSDENTWKHSHLSHLSEEYPQCLGMEGSELTPSEVI